MLKNILLVAGGGAAGCVARYLLTRAAGRMVSGIFPFGTFSVNILGCLLIGVFAGILERQQPGGGALRLLLISGFCGGFTTFSSFALDNLTLHDAHALPTALLYTALSVCGGFAAVAAGMWLSK